jgi:hypothetical protein
MTIKAIRTKSLIWEFYLLLKLKKNSLQFLRRFSKNKWIFNIKTNHQSNNKFNNSKKL